MGTQFVENLDIMKFLVVLSAFVAASHAAPQLVYPYGLGYSHAITHAVPTTVKKVNTRLSAMSSFAQCEIPIYGKVRPNLEAFHPLNFVNVTARVQNKDHSQENAYSE